MGAQGTEADGLKILGWVRQEPPEALEGQVLQGLGAGKNQGEQEARRERRTEGRLHEEEDMKRCIQSKSKKMDDI